ncbi:DNA/RNA non-specific endonuclease, partial [Longimicrobium sp.]|uniref:DNA/RNA non-specific endonuclease n=1 Tax=Longimicrobium sp. TaxID=2029185 RepID=UPI002E34C900
IYGATPATLNGAGRVAIPSHTWKVIVVMNGGQGLADVTSASSIQVIAVNMPNVGGIQANDWPMYRTTVDAIEAATGYDLLSALPDAIEAAVEAAQ